MAKTQYVTTTTAALAIALFFVLPVSIAFDALICTVATLLPDSMRDLGFMSPAMSQPVSLTGKQSDALTAYNNALNNFRSILRQRRAQIDGNLRLPNLPGQALYLARNDMLSAHKDLTDAIASKIGGPNKLGIP